MADQRAYWDRVAPDKTFTHPLNEAWLRAAIPPEARLLDFGCGYGRTLTELARLGYRDAVGVDFAPAMIARGRRQSPELDLRLSLAEMDGAFDAVLLMAVLTCIPDDAEQDALVDRLRRLLRPGGVLYVSDMPLQTDARNLRRYADAHSRLDRYGVFETEDGAVVRHHAEERFAALFAGFERIAVRDVAVGTMNGNPAVARQFLLRAARPG